MFSSVLFSLSPVSSLRKVFFEFVSGSYWEGYFRIPYAHAPVGLRRWERPEPVVSFGKDIVDGTKFGPVCMQAGAVSEDGVSEDCLFINIWVPIGAKFIR